MIFWGLLFSTLIACGLLFLPRYTWLGVGSATLYLGALLLVGYFHIMLIPVALALLLLWIYWIVHSKGNSKYRWLKRSLLAISVICSILAGVVLYGLPVSHFPDPAGAYKVGTSRFIVSETLPVQIWYPTDAQTQNAPYLLEGQALIEGLSKTLGVPPIALQHWLLITTPAQLDAPILMQSNTFPVILFTHGLGGFKAQNTALMLELASHGYFVVAVDQPTYAAATVVNQELILDQHPELVGAMISDLDEHMGQWLTNMQLVIQELPDINRQFNGMLDVNRMAAIGHSFGGATAYQLLSTEPQILAAVNMDGGFFGAIEPSLKPFLLFNAESTLDVVDFTNQVNSVSDEEFLNIIGLPKEDVLVNFDALLERRCRALQGNSYAVLISDVQHISFSDLPRLSPLFQTPVNAEPILAAAILPFFDDTLSRSSVFSLDEAVNQFASVIALEGCE